MKKIHLLTGGSLLAVLLAGCGHLDLSAENDPNRVLNGTVVFNQPNPLPDDAEILIRVVDEHPEPLSMQADAANRPPLLNQPVTANAAVPPPGPEVLAELTLRHPGASPVPFKIEYRAEDEELRHGLNIEVRVSFGGHMQMFNSNQYSLGLTDFKDPHVVEADLH